MRRTNKIFLFFAMIVFLSGCVRPGQRPRWEDGIVPSSTTQADQEVTGTAPVIVITGTPQAGTAPEKVVANFLNLYENDPNQMIAYLSAGLLAKLPNGGVYELLGFSGILNGFVFESGYIDADHFTAQVKVGLLVDNEAVYRTFTLIMIDDEWLIDQILEE